MKKIIQIISTYFAELCGWLLIVIIGLLVTDLITRGMYSPIQGIAEVSIFVLVATVYLGLPHCEQMRGHVAIDAFVDRMPIRLRKIIDSTVYLLASLFLIILLFSVGQTFIGSYQSGEVIAGTLPLLIWPVRLAIFVGILFYCLQAILNTIDEFKKTISILGSNQH